MSFDELRYNEPPDSYIAASGELPSASESQTILLAAVESSTIAADVEPWKS